MNALSKLKELCESECYEELDECSFIKEVEGEVPLHLVLRALKELLSAAEERGCDPSLALEVLINLASDEKGARLGGPQAGGPGGGQG